MSTMTITRLRATTQSGSRLILSFRGCTLLIFILGLSGNGVVIFTVWRAKSKRRAADVYIGNLALADLTFVITLPLWAVYTALGYHWPFGVALCKISSYVVLVNMYASVFCLTCLSFDRYLAIVHSLSSGRLRSRATMLASLGAIWFLSCLLAVPTLLFALRCMTPGTTAPPVRWTSAWSLSIRITNTFGLLVWAFHPPLLGFSCLSWPWPSATASSGCTVTRHFSHLRKEDQKKASSPEDHHYLGGDFCILLDAFPCAEEHGCSVISRPGAHLMRLPKLSASGSSVCHVAGVCQTAASTRSSMPSWPALPLAVPVSAEPEESHAWAHELHVFNLSAQTQKSEVQSLATKVWGNKMRRTENMKLKKKNIGLRWLKRWESIDGWSVLMWWTNGLMMENILLYVCK